MGGGWSADALATLVGDESPTSLAPDFAREVTADLLCSGKGERDVSDKLSRLATEHAPTHAVVGLVKRHAVEDLLGELDVVLLVEDGALGDGAVDDLACRAVATDGRHRLALGLESDGAAVTRSLVPVRTRVISSSAPKRRLVAEERRTFPPTRPRRRSTAAPRRGNRRP